MKKTMIKLISIQHHKMLVVFTIDSELNSNNNHVEYKPIQVKYCLSGFERRCDVDTYYIRHKAKQLSQCALQVTTSGNSFNYSKCYVSITSFLAADLHNHLY